MASKYDVNSSDFDVLKRIILAWRDSGDVLEGGFALRLSGVLDATPDSKERAVGKFQRDDLVALRLKARSDRLGGATAADVDRARQVIEDWLRESGLL